MADAFVWIIQLPLVHIPPHLVYTWAVEGPFTAREIADVLIMTLIVIMTATVITVTMCSSGLYLIFDWL
jgi:hypothetical protein